jgi:hypothetical protein
MRLANSRTDTYSGSPRPSTVNRHHGRVLPRSPSGGRRALDRAQEFVSAALQLREERSDLLEATLQLCAIDHPLSAAAESLRPHRPRTSSHAGCLGQAPCRTRVRHRRTHTIDSRRSTGPQELELPRERAPARVGGLHALAEGRDERHLVAGPAAGHPRGASRCVPPRAPSRRASAGTP